MKCVGLGERHSAPKLHSGSTLTLVPELLSFNDSHVWSAILLGFAVKSVVAFIRSGDRRAREGPRPRGKFRLQAVVGRVRTRGRWLALQRSSLF